MKHVFIIHSHTTFLSAYGVIKLKNIEEKEVIFLYSRNYSNSIITFNCTCFDISNIITKIQGKVFKNAISLRKSLHIVDNFINNNICESYHLYAPHFAMGIAQILYTHHLCIDGSYIQEGGLVFTTAYKTSFTTKERIKYFIKNKIVLMTTRVWRPNKWFVVGSLKKQKVINSYAISDDFFRFLPSQNHIIKWPKIEITIRIDSTTPIFIFDGYIKNGLAEPDFYMNQCKKLVQEYSAPDNFLKFHPAQSSEEKNNIINELKRLNKNFHILDDTVPIELIISSKKNLLFIGFNSSLLYFAKDYGHRVVSKDYWMFKSTLFQKYMTNYGFKPFEDYA